MKMINSILILSVLLFIAATTRAQDDPFNIDEYKAFLQQHQNMQTNELLQMFPAGTFEQNINSNWSSALYSDSVEIKFNLTEYEIELINKNGFAVTERVFTSSFGELFLGIYHSDLPVFVSTDAILHSVHMSYDRILLETEVGFLYDKLIEMLELMHSQISTLENTYASHPEILERLKDVDVSLSVPRKLLNENSQLHYQSNAAITDSLLNFIDEEEFKEIEFFSTSTRKSSPGHTS